MTRTLRLIRPNGQPRDYSLWGGPGGRTQWEIAVLPDSAARGAGDYLREQLRIGERVAS